MKSRATRATVLNQLFDYLPDQAVERLRTMNIDDALTVVRACGAVREHQVLLPSAIVHQLHSWLSEEFATSANAGPEAVHALAPGAVRDEDGAPSRSANKVRSESP